MESADPSGAARRCRSAAYPACSATAKDLEIGLPGRRHGRQIATTSAKAFNFQHLSTILRGSDVAQVCCLYLQFTWRLDQPPIEATYSLCILVRKPVPKVQPPIVVPTDWWGVTPNIVRHEFDIWKVLTKLFCTHAIGTSDNSGGWGHSKQGKFRSREHVLRTPNHNASRNIHW